jgi:rod shape-determining protein MreC
MKSRVVLIVILVIVLLILTGRNNSGLQRLILDFINPIRIGYKEFTREIESKSKSYIFQKKEIERLTQENRVLRKYLFDQTHYIKQLSNIYEVIPSLRKLPYKNIALVDTISYVKLNKFDQILLSLPPNYELNSSKVYGLIQKEQVGGIAKFENGHLYGYLVSNPECSFSVIVGPKNYPGIAFGKDYKSMVVKFIPKWADVKKGDFVQTSGLDGIFFAHIPVGVVESVSVKESYKVATVKFLADIMHPDIFFLILDSKPYLVSYYDRNSSFPNQEYPFKNQPPLKREANLTSIPTNQTKDEHFDPTEFEIPTEEKVIERSIQSSTTPSIAPKTKVKKEKKTTKPKKTKHKKVKAKKRKKPKKIDNQLPITPNTPLPTTTPNPPKEEKKRPSPFDILRA